MLSSKGLHILECNQVSHPQARTKSFKVKIKAEDYEKAMNGDTWPYRIRVRPYKHFRPREEGGTFGESSNKVENDRQTESNNTN